MEIFKIRKIIFSFRESKLVTCKSATIDHSVFAANERELREKEAKMMELQETYETLLLQHKVR